MGVDQQGFFRVSYTDYKKSRRLKTDIWDRYSFAVQMKIFVSKFWVANDEIK